MDSTFNYLAHFFGAKGENDEFVDKLLSMVLSDYAHWRRNYFPDDPYLLTPSLQRRLEDETETITKETQTMLAGLRRSFPFYSPRYIAHQQSETTIASLIGTIAGTLYNSNNVTPESGIATVEWEVDACNDLLRMLGYDAPPDPPDKAQDFDEYTKKLQREFGWCHLASGGTVANIEALWVARTVKYFPLSVRDACREMGIGLGVKLPDRSRDGTSELEDAYEDIREVDDARILGIRPNESIFLLGRFVQKAIQEKGWSLEDASAKSWSALNQSPYSPANGIGKAFVDFPPAIFVSGAAHYSIKKAADLLGMGRGAVRSVPMDANFRMDIDALRSEMSKAIADGHCIVAVIAIVGTTEEGAVDPLHAILELRAEFEREHGHSFWVHVDAAWGGFIRSVFVDDLGASDERVTYRLLKKRLYRLAGLFGKPPFDITFDRNPEAEPREWVAELLAKLYQWDVGRTGKAGKPLPPSATIIDPWFHDADLTGNYRDVLGFIHATVNWYAPDVSKSEFSIKLIDRVTDTRDFVSAPVTLKISTYSKTLNFRWPPDNEVGMAFFAVKDADSVTVDPHKMGYTVYPNGAVAFKNDRVRHFIRQEAPYITSTHANHLVHLPIRHAEPPVNELSDTKISTDAFGPFTLEGSRPSASACSLWLASKTMPFSRNHHGTIVRSSLLSARTLYEWLVRWDKIADFIGEDTRYELIPFASGPPDTNIVIFGVKEKGNTDIQAFNLLNKSVHSRFAIQSELGRRQHSYAQPFFLSKTEFRNSDYPLTTLTNFLTRHNFRNPKAHYEKHGLTVLRATVMNPYILPIHEITDRNLISEFLREMHRIIEKILPKFTGGQVGP